MKRSGPSALDEIKGGRGNHPALSNTHKKEPAYQPSEPHALGVTSSESGDKAKNADDDKHAADSVHPLPIKLDRLTNRPGSGGTKRCGFISAHVKLDPVLPNAAKPPRAQFLRPPLRAA